MSGKNKKTCPRCKNQIYPTIEGVTQNSGRVRHRVVWMHREGSVDPCPRVPDLT